MNEIVPYGKPRIIVCGGVADALTFNLRPPAGKTWWVILAYGYTDDTVVAQTQVWSIYDGTNTFLFSTIVTPQYQHVLLGRDGTAISALAHLGPILLNYRTYAIYTISALAGGKKIFGVAYVLEWDER